MEEQTATVNEIGRNVAEAARGSNEIARNITSVAQAAQGTTDEATHTQKAGLGLARMAAELQQLVGRFRYETTNEDVLGKSQAVESVAHPVRSSGSEARGEAAGAVRQPVALRP